MCSEIIISFPNAQAQKHKAQSTLPTCVSKKLHTGKLNHVIVQRASAARRILQDLGNKSH